MLQGGTFYHLWYLPAVLLGTLITTSLNRKFGLKVTFIITTALYLIGLGGDSYYGLVSTAPPLKTMYDVIFSVFRYTRNGLFFAPVFLTMGAGLFSEQNRDTATRAPWVTAGFKAAIGLALSAVLLFLEALLLRRAGVQRHDSMYIMLLPTMYFLFSLLQQFDSRGSKKLRIAALVIYIIHPWCIVLVRGFAKITQGSALLVQNQLVLFILVCALSAAAAALFTRLSPMIRLSLLSRNTGSTKKSRAWIEIDRDALSHNARELQHLLPASCRLMAVVKADAYGHGAVDVAKTLQRVGVDDFAVATMDEGITLRKNGINGNILVLGYTRPADAATLRRFCLSQTVFSGAYANALHETGVPLNVHLKIDTGMHRLGFNYSDLTELERLFDYETLIVQGMFTHLSRADDLSAAATSFTLNQISRFIDTVNTLKAKNFPVGKLHIQESYGILNYPGLPCDYARAGIALYGVLGQNGKTSLTPDLRPVLSLKARIAEVKWVDAGDAVSYGSRFIAPSQMKVATVTIGYADGIPRNGSGAGVTVLLHGRSASVIGLICMDLMMIDVTKIDEAAVGDTVTIIGRDGDARLRCEDVAERYGTISNELLSRLGPRLPRVLL